MPINIKSIFSNSLSLLLALIISCDVYASDIANSQVHYLDRSSLNMDYATHLSVADGLSSDIVKCIYRDSHNLLWIGTSSGLNRWDGHEVRVYNDPQLPFNLHSAFVTLIQEDVQDNLWIEWDNKNIVYLRENDSFVPLSEYIKELKPDTHYNTLIDEKKNIWCFNQNGELSKFDHSGKLQGEIKLTRDFGDRMSWTAQKDGSILILCGNAGIIKVAPNMKSSLFLAKMINDKKFEDHNLIYTDSSGKIWIYSYQDTKINSFDPSTNEWDRIVLPGSIDTGNCINGLADNNDELLLISTDHKGIYVLDKKTNTVINHIEQTEGIDHSLVSNRISDLYLDKEGNIWIGYLRNGLSVIHSSSIIKPYRDNTVGEVLSILVDEGGKTWIGTEGNGLYYRDNNGNLKKWDGVPNVAIMSLSKTHDGKIVAGSYDHGIYLIDANSTSPYSLAKGNFPTNNAWLTKTDRNGNIWIGSIVDGLFKMKPDGEAKRICNVDGSKVSVVYMYEDNSDSLYVSTGNGYVRVNINNDKVSSPVMGNKSGSKQFLHPYISNIFKDSDNIIWLGHSGGLTAFDQRTDSIYHISMTDGLVNNTVSDIT